MSIFGWSYPPGCTGTPYDEAQASCITQYLSRKPSGVLDVYWDEDGNLLESFAYTADYSDGKGGTVPVKECDYRKVGAVEWNDELSDEQNFVLAAAEYERIVGIGNVAKCKLAFDYADGPGEVYRLAYKYTDCGPSVGFLVRYTVEEVTDAGPCAGELYEVERDKWFYCDDTYKLGTWDRMIEQGAEILAISVSSIVEGVDYDTDTVVIEFSQDDTPESIRKKFDDAIEEVNDQANSIWNDTHGCDTCRKHWIAEGIKDGETEFGCPVWTDCPDCEGVGTVI